MSGRADDAIEIDDSDSDDEVIVIVPPPAAKIKTQGPRRKRPSPASESRTSTSLSVRSPPESLTSSPYVPLDLPQLPPAQKKNVNERHSIGGNASSILQKAAVPQQETTERRVLGKSARVLQKHEASKPKVAPNRQKVAANMPKIAPPLRKLPKPQGIMKKTSRFGPKPALPHQSGASSTRSKESAPAAPPSSRMQPPLEPKKSQPSAAPTVDQSKKIFHTSNLVPENTALRRPGDHNESNEKPAAKSRPTLPSMPSLEDREENGMSSVAAMPSPDNDSSSFSGREKDLDENPWDSDEEEDTDNVGGNQKPAAIGSKRSLDEASGNEVIDLLDSSSSDSDDESTTCSQSVAKKNSFRRQIATGATLETAITVLDSSSSSSSESEEELEDDYEIKNSSSTATVLPPSQSQKTSEETIEEKEARERESINASLKRRAVNAPRQRHGTPPQRTSQEPQQVKSPTRTVSLKEQRRIIRLSKAGSSAPTSPGRSGGSPGRRKEYTAHTELFIEALPPQRPQLRVVPKSGRSARAMQESKMSTVVTSPQRPTFQRPPPKSTETNRNSGRTKTGRSSINISHDISAIRTDFLNQLIGTKKPPQKLLNQDVPLETKRTELPKLDKRSESAIAKQTDIILKQPERKTTDKESATASGEQNREPKSKDSPEYGKPDRSSEQYLIEEGVGSGRQVSDAGIRPSLPKDKIETRKSPTATDDEFEPTSSSLLYKEKTAKSLPDAIDAAPLMSEGTASVEEIIIVSSEESEKSSQVVAAVEYPTAFDRVEENEFAKVFEDDDDSLDIVRQTKVPLDATAEAEIERQAADVDLPAWISCVDHLSEKKKGNNGLPIWNFTVHTGDDGTLYDFQVYAAKSQIPGAGFGAFLAFKGARELCPESRERGERLLLERSVVYEPITMEPLQAVMEDGGSGVTVKLKGDNLHGNNNCVYWPPKAREVLRAKIPRERISRGSIFENLKEKVKVRVVGESIHGSEEFEAYSVSGNGPLQPIGHLGIHVAADYKRAPHITSFPKELAKSNCIDLGRYGPFRVQDRKEDEKFSLKSFIFSHGPAEWSFGVEETLNDSPQVIDITDESTGETHELAMGEIPMFVNETGYSSAYKQTVFLKHWHDRVVQYYIKLDQELRKGSPIELLTSYTPTYEDIRERKGYGLKNILRGADPDSCAAARLERNIEDREDVENIIDDCETIEKLWDILHYIFSEIWQPIASTIEKLLASPQSSKSIPLLTNKQWIAARRIQWLVYVARRWLERNKQVREQDDKTNMTLFLIYEYKINKFLESIDRLSFVGPVLSLDPSAQTASRDSIAEVVRDELVDEICYVIKSENAKDVMPLAMDDSVYCAVARRLITNLCHSAARFYMFCNRDTEDEEKKAKEDLLQSFLNAAVKSRDEILSCIKGAEEGGNVSDLKFSPGVIEGSIFSGSEEAIFRDVKTSASFFLDNRTTPKSYRAALLEKIQYSDALALAGMAPAASHNRGIMVDSKSSLVMVECGAFSGHDELRKLGSVPLSVTETSKRKARINATWYINWQVVWTVDLFARFFLGSDFYSLQDLCNMLGSDIKLARFVTQRGVINDNEGYCKFWRPEPWDVIKSRSMPKTEKKSGKPKPKKKTKSNYNQGCVAGRPKAKLIYEGPPNTEFPGNGDWPAGWSQKTYQRASGASKGGTDNYWFPPEGSPKLRSRLEVQRYLARR